MIRSLAAAALVAVAISAASGGCSSAEAAPATECKPGKLYFCKCSDLSDGEKTCNADGDGYAACMRSVVEGTECPGGELAPAVDAGKRVEPGPTEIVTSDRRQCPGKTAVLEIGKPLALEGDTADASPKQTGAGACAVATGNEHVYAVTPRSDGKLEAVLQGLDDVTLYARRGSCADGDQIVCAERAGSARAEKISIDVTAGETYWLFADTHEGAIGKYTLSVSLAAPSTERCGDGVVQPGEACDDGDENDTNGCSRACLPAGDDLAVGGCPGVAVHVWDTPVTFTGSTRNMGKQFQYEGLECGATYVTGVDRVYAVTAHKTGTLEVRTSAADFDHALYARAGSCTTKEHVACADTIPRGTGGEKLAFPVVSGKTYYVVIDGYLTARGAFTMTVGIE